MEERCICCGEIIPEGRQVCINCENNAERYSEKWKIKKLKSKMVHIEQASEIKGKTFHMR